MTNKWDIERLRRYINDQVQEDLNLEYKGAEALGKSDGKKKEIHKDVSAMANSAGGVLIYGIREFDERAKKYLPERLDPVDQSIFSREWLEQIISGIQPRIQGVVITPVPLGGNLTDAAFVVEIPASNTAHQASDFRYYKRYNSESVPMNAYEIRDVMNRSSQAIIELDLELEFEHRQVDTLGTAWGPPQSGSVSELHGFGQTKEKRVLKTKHNKFAFLNIKAENIGAVYAQHVVAYFYLPIDLFDDESDIDQKLEDGRGKIRIDNNQSASSGNRYWQTPGLPILPGTSDTLGTIHLAWHVASDKEAERKIYWEVFCDSAQMRTGYAKLSDLQVDAKRHSTHREYDPMDLLGR